MTVLVDLRLVPEFLFTAGTMYRSLNSLAEALSLSLITERGGNLLKPFSWSAALTFSVGKQQFFSYLSIQNSVTYPSKMALLVLT